MNYRGIGETFGVKKSNAFGKLKNTVVSFFLLLQQCLRYQTYVEESSVSTLRLGSTQLGSLITVLGICLIDLLPKLSILLTNNLLKVIPSVPCYCTSVTPKQR